MSINTQALFETLVKSSPISRYVPTTINIDFSQLKYFSLNQNYLAYTKGENAHNGILLLSLSNGVNNKIYFENKNHVYIKKILTTNKEMHILTNEGKLYSYSYSNISNVMTLNNYFLSTLIVDISCNDKITICVNNKNIIYFWGLIGNSKYITFPYQIELITLELPVSKMSLGDKYLTFLSLTGKVFFTELNTLFEQNKLSSINLVEIQYNQKISNVLSGTDVIVMCNWENNMLLLFNEKSKMKEININNYHLSSYDITRCVKIVGNIIFLDVINKEKEKFLIEIDYFKERTLRIFKLINGDDCFLIPSLFFYNKLYLSKLRDKTQKKQFKIIFHLLSEEDVNTICKKVVCNNIKNNQSEKSFVKKDIKKALFQKNIKLELEKLNKELHSMTRASSTMRLRESQLQRNKSVLQISNYSKESFIQKDIAEKFKTRLGRNDDRSNNLLQQLQKNHSSSFQKINKILKNMIPKQPKKAKITNFLENNKSPTMSFCFCKVHQSNNTNTSHYSSKISDNLTKRGSFSVSTNFTDKELKQSLQISSTKSLVRSISQPRLSMRDASCSDSISIENFNSPSLTSRIRNKSTILSFLINKKKSLMNKSLLG